MYFTLQDLGGVEGVGRWLRVAEQHRSALGRVMATRYSEGMYLEDRVSNCFSALESLDRERKQDKVQDLAVRLRRCVSLAGEPFTDLVGDDVEAWIVQSKRHRDDLTHHYARLWRETSTMEVELADQLFWLFTLCMLRMADAPDAVFASIREHRKFRWLASRK